MSHFIKIEAFILSSLNIIFQYFIKIRIPRRVRLVKMWLNRKNFLRLCANKSFWKCYRLHTLLIGFTKKLHNSLELFQENYY